MVVRGRKIIRWDAAADSKFDVVCFKIVATETQRKNITTLLKTEPLIELMELRPYTAYVFHISSCLDSNGSICGKPATIGEITDVGCESQKQTA